MGHSPDARLFYGYCLPADFEVPDSAEDTFLRDEEPVRIGYHGYEHGTPHVEITATATGAPDYGSESVDLAALMAAVPADADYRLRAFAAEHGLPLPGARIDPGSEYDDDAASAVGWWIAAHYG